MTGFSSSQGRSLLPVDGDCDLPLTLEGLGVRFSPGGGVSRRETAGLGLEPGAFAGLGRLNHPHLLPVPVSFNLSSLLRSNAARYRS
jgi:hypothetical protein